MGTGHRYIFSTSEKRNPDEVTVRGEIDTNSHGYTGLVATSSY